MRGAVQSFHVRDKFTKGVLLPLHSNLESYFGEILDARVICQTKALKFMLMDLKYLIPVVESSESPEVSKVLEPLGAKGTGNRQMFGGLFGKVPLFCMVCRKGNRANTLAVSNKQRPPPCYFGSFDSYGFLFYYIPQTQRHCAIFHPTVSGRHAHMCVGRALTGIRRHSRVRAFTQARLSVKDSIQEPVSGRAPLPSPGDQGSPFSGMLIEPVWCANWFLVCKLVSWASIWPRPGAGVPMSKLARSLG